MERSNQAGAKQYGVQESMDRETNNETQKKEHWLDANRYSKWKEMEHSEQDKQLRDIVKSQALTSQKTLHQW